MPLDLAALLVEAGAASAADVQRALERQRAQGGALDTALLELGLVDERELVRFLERASGLPPAPVEAVPDAAARGAVPVRVAERHGVVPLRLEGRQLSVAVVHPTDVGTLQELSAMLSVELVPHVAPEWRVRALLARVYGGELAPRFAALAPAAAAPGSETEPPIALTFGLAEPEEPLAAALAQALEGEGLEALLAGAPQAEPTSAVPPRWSRDDAFAALESAAGRDEVVAVALRYALDFFEGAALLAVTRERVTGHDAVGWSGARERCRAVQLERHEAGLLRAVLGTSGPYLGPVAREPGNERLVAGLGREWPRTALVYPVAVRDRTVCVLYADNGEAPVSPARLGDLLLVLGGLGGAFERVLRQGKRARAERREAQGGWAVREPARADDGRSALASARLPEGGGEGGWGTTATPTTSTVTTTEKATATEKATEKASPGPTATAGTQPGASATTAGSAPVKAPASPPPRDATEAVARLAAAPRGSPERAELLARLGREGPDAAAALRAAFPGPIEVSGRGAEIPVEERGPLLAALVALGPVATPYVVDLLRDGDPARRRLAALLAGRIGDPAAFLPLADAALDPDRGARDGALASLALHRHHSEFRPVVERLRRSLVAGEGERRARAARALGALGDEESIPLLVQALDAADPVHGAAEAALEALTGSAKAGADGWLAWWRDRSRRPRA